MSRRVGYVVSRFPKTTETFIVREMEAVERLGWDVSLFAIVRETDEIVQPGAATFVERLTAISDLRARDALRAQWRWLRRRPAALGQMWLRAITGNLRSPKFLVRAIAVAWGAPWIAERAQAQQCEHLHAHWATHSALLAHLVAELTGLSYSVTVHAHDLHVNRTMLAAKLAGASAVVTISDHNAHIIRDTVPAVAEATTVVHCGVDTAAIPLRTTEARREGPVRIVTVAGLRPFKGHRHLLDAIEILRARGYDVHCDLVGDGPIRAELEARAGDGIVFHGAIPVDAALDIVRAADVAVMPSVELADGRRDGIPVALIEAMAIGVPVVASNVSGIPELVRDGDTGLLVPPGNPFVLADAVERVLTDPSTAARLTRAARQLVVSRFDLEQGGKAMTVLFDEAVGRARRNHVIRDATERAGEESLTP